LASLSFPFREALSRSGACSLIIENLPRYDNKIEFVQEACEAMMHLSLNPSNSVIIGSIGGSELIVNYLDKILMEYPMGVDVCCGALLNLVTYGETAKKNKLKIMNADAVDHIRRALASTKASYRARETALQLLEILGADRIAGSSKTSSNNDLVGVVNINGPLAVEIREYTSFDNLINNKSTNVFKGVQQNGANRSRGSSAHSTHSDTNGMVEL
jgi:hypothetical protein